MTNQGNYTYKKKCGCKDTRTQVGLIQEVVSYAKKQLGVGTGRSETCGGKLILSYNQIRENNPRTESFWMNVDTEELD